MSQLPPFLLQDAEGGRHSFPTGRPALIGFVKEDCPTCDAAMPTLCLVGADGQLQERLAGLARDAQEVVAVVPPPKPKSLA